MTLMPQAAMAAIYFSTACTYASLTIFSINARSSLILPKRRKSNCTTYKLISVFRLAVSAITQSAWENVSVFPFFVKLVSLTTFATGKCSKLVCGEIILFSVHETTSL